MIGQENLINIPSFTFTSCDGKYIYLECQQLVYLSISQSTEKFDRLIDLPLIFFDICDITLNIFGFWTVG